MSVVQVFGRASDTTSCVYHLNNNLNNSGPGNGLSLGGENDAFNYSSRGKWGNCISCDPMFPKGSNASYPGLSSDLHIDPLKTDFYLDFWIRFKQAIEADLTHFDGLGFVIRDQGDTGRILVEAHPNRLYYDKYQETDFLASAGPETPWIHLGFAGLKGEQFVRVILFLNGIPFAVVMTHELYSPKFGHYTEHGDSGPESGSVSHWTTSSYTEISEIHFSQHLPEIKNYKPNPTNNDIKTWRLTVPSGAYTGSGQWLGWQYLSGQKVYDGAAWQTLKATDKIYLNGAWHELGACDHVWAPVIDGATGSRQRCSVCGYICQHPPMFIGTCPICGYTI